MCTLVSYQTVMISNGMHFVLRTDSLYFQEEELDEINNLAQFGQELRGRVSERIKDIEGLSMVVSSSDSYCTTEDEDQEEDNNRHGDDDVRHGDDDGCHGDDNDHLGDDDGYHGEDNHGLRSSGNDSEIVQTASRQARLKWQQRDEGITVSCASHSLPTEWLALW